MVSKQRIKSYKLALGFKAIAVLGITFTYCIIALTTKDARDSLAHNINQESLSHIRGRHLLSTVEKANCTPAAINEFPSDGLTRAQRKSGWALLHAALACYLFILLATVCDDYFVPAIKTLCSGLQLKEDIAGATFMATASSSPELFINSIGTFITQGDIGVGTIVGSAVFNVLAVPACCGLFSNMCIQLEWWPITRDGVMYGISVLMLIGFLHDGKIEIHEAAVLVSAYAVYLAVMCFNGRITNAVMRLSRTCKKRRNYTQILSETRPLLRHDDKNCLNGFQFTANGDITLKDCEDLEESTNIWKWPSENTKGKKCWWILTWPISFLFYITMPDCRKYPKWYPVTFLMCIFWIGTTSYMVAWLITALGDTFDIPDSVMGLTFLAAGTSVPEAVSCIIVTNQGYGSMGISSSIGSNTFDVLLCLGLPWLIKTWFYPKIPGDHSILINSSGLPYSALALLTTLILFYSCLFYNKFRLDWKIGLVCLFMYIAFLTFASLVEMNVLFPVNLPTCDR